MRSPRACAAVICLRTICANADRGYKGILTHFIKTEWR